MLYASQQREFCIPKNASTLTGRGVLHVPLPPAPAGAGRRKQATVPISDITNQAKTRKGPPCSVCETLTSLPQPEADALRSLLEDPTWRYTTLSDELRAEGVDLAPFVLSRHARGKCAARVRMR